MVKSPFLPLLLILSVLAGSMARADVHLPAIFGSHMVLQQELKIPVWGTADAGEKVTVELGSAKAEATTGADGKWRVDLPQVHSTPTATPLTLTVTGKNSIKFDDVLVGDVWICSGQSNMEFDLGGDKSFGGAANAATAVPAANDPLLRLFIVQRKLADQPETDVVGEWKVCTPESAALFSAVGYFFGQELRKSIKCPIGLIGTYWGGKPAQAFTSLSGLKKEPPFEKYVTTFEDIMKNFDRDKVTYPARQAAYQTKLKKWNETTGVKYAAAQKEWIAACRKAREEVQPMPDMPKPAIPMPKPPMPPGGDSSTPTVLFNGMIAPLIPYAIKGVIWYQGESNAGNGAQYRTLFPRMIGDWREKWNQGDFPFLFVQLANYMKPQFAPSEGGWALLREAQLKTLAVKNTGMAVTIDIGNPKDIHPKDKLDVGLRLALAAKHIAYGQELVYSGPIYDSMKVDGFQIRLSFTQTGSGLVIGIPPWSPVGNLATPSELTGFAVCGADRKWEWAKAKIDGNEVVVYSTKVEKPVAVRYGWANCPPCDLYNKEGLPASPFRTDDWEEAPKPPKR